MANTGLSVGPWQIAELDPYLINEVFRQIEQQINLLRGLGGLPPTSPISTSSSGSIAIGKHTHVSDVTGGQISHDSALLEVSIDDHHSKAHTHDGDGSGDLNLDALVPSSDLEDAYSTSSNPRDFIIAGPNVSITESDESGAMVLTTTGFSGTVTPVVSITVINGVVTAVS